jgi:hypothetical protein
MMGAGGGGPSGQLGDGRMQWLIVLLLPVVAWILLVWRSWLVGARPAHRHTLGPTPSKSDLLDHAVELYGEVANRRREADATIRAGRREV